MNAASIKDFLATTTARLAGTYLAIIMLMSIGFSVVFYATSYHQLGRQIMPHSFNQITRFYQFGQIGPREFSPEVTQYLQQRISEGRAVLLQRLVLLNIGTLCLGSVLSYILARRTLQPIEDNMEAQVQFVSDASHELRTPLTAIQTSNEVALRNPNLTLQEAKEVIAQDTEDVKRLKELSDGLLSLTHQGRALVGAKPVTLQDITSEAMTQVVHQATEKGIAVTDTTENLTVLGDHKSLVRLLVILLDNAVKYSHKNGRIYLAACKRDNHAWITVRDEGVGMSQADVPHIFERFYRADSARTRKEYGGYGLGLAIANRIVTNHQGSISVQSKLNEGSTFTVKLPLA